MGMPWMRGPEESWLCKKSFSPAPEEEFRKDMLEGACNVVKGTQQYRRTASLQPGEGDWTGW